MKSFEEAFAEVEALLSNPPPDLRQDIIDLAHDCGVEPAPLAEALYGAVTVGREITDSLAVTLKGGPTMLGDRKPSPLVRATGSSGNAITDGPARGVIFGALNGILLFLQVEFDLLSAEGVVALESVLIFLAFSLGGLWDRFIAPKLRAS